MSKMKLILLGICTILCAAIIGGSALPGLSAIALSAAASDLSVTCEETNSWDEGGKTHSQYAVTIKNNGSETVKGWTISITVPDGSTLGDTDSWNGTFKISGTTLTITPASYNKDIAAGQEAKDIGFIITTPKAVSLTATVAAGSTSVTSPDDTDKPADGSGTGDDGESKPSEPAIDLSTVPQDDDWLHAEGNRILDKDGKEVWLTGINWFGYNTGTNVFDGVWAVNMKTALADIADHGFNILRIPISAELVLAWKNGEYPTANFNQAENAELVGMNSLEIFDLAVSTCRANGLKIMLDIHSAETNAAGHIVNLWYTDKISETQYIDALKFLADRYKQDDTVIAFDLKNEPHGKPNENKAIWNDSTDPNNWKAVAEKAGNAVLDINPNVLILIEGIEIYPKDIANNGDFASTNSDDYFFNWWGGNLRGVRDFPIDFGSPERNSQIVYSPHDYGPAVFAQPWFDGEYTYESLQEDCWNENWFFIQEEGIAPLLIGEWGGFMTEPNLSWMTHLRTFIAENRIHHTFWCFNANSGDTGGLVKDDFRTWDEEKYAFVKEVLWQEDGQFIGLDHVLPLGASGQGTSLSYESGDGTAVTEPAVTTNDSETSSGANPSTAEGSDAATASGTNLTENTDEDQPNVEFLVGILVGVGAVVILVGATAFIFILRRRPRS